MKLLGSGRIAVTFPYKDEVIARLRRLADRKWNAELRQWEIGVAHLHELLEIFNLEPADVDRSLVRAYQMYRIRHGRARIAAGNVEAFLSGMNLPLEKIDRKTSFFLPGYRFMTRFKKGTWDGRKHLFNFELKSFPSGLSPRVARIVREEGVECDITWPEEPPRDLFEKAQKLPTKGKGGRPRRMTALRDYQREGMEVALLERRGIIEIATGGGKTLLAAHLIHHIGRPALFLVHTRDLMYQTVEVLQHELRMVIGCAGDGKLDLQPVTVATVQTCARALDIKLDNCSDDEPLLKEEPPRAEVARAIQAYLRTVPVVFFDECHHVPADTAYGLACELEGALWRYGLSATPYRADRQDLLLEAAIGPRIYSARASALIDRGHLVPPRIKFLTVPPLVIKSGTADYQEVYASYIVENRARNRMIVEIAREICKEGKTVLILVNHVRHGQILQEMLRPVDLVQGSEPVVERQKIFKALGEKKCMLAIATSLADEGLDIPSLDCIILASAGRSETRALQRVGRVLRKAPGKKSALVIDFLDDAPYLRDHSSDRMRIYQSEHRFVLES